MANIFLWCFFLLYFFFTITVVIFWRILAQSARNCEQVQRDNGEEKKITLHDDDNEHNAPWLGSEQVSRLNIATVVPLYGVL